MHQLTVRGLDDELSGHLRRLAASQGISLSQAAIRLMRRGVGLSEGDRADVVGRALDAFMGTWSEEEAEEFTQSIASTEAIDAELWR